MEFQSPFKFPDITDRINEACVTFNDRPVTKYKEFKNHINSEVYDEAVAYNYINEAFIKKSEVDSKDFGLPEKKKYPMPDEKHVKSAIKFFNYVDKEDEEELAKNIKKKIKQYNITDISVGKNNRFSKYYKSEEKKKAVNEHYHGEANSYMEFESVLFENGQEADLRKKCKLAVSSLKEAINKVSKSNKINGSDLGIKLGYKSEDLSDPDQADLIEIGSYDIDKFLSKNKVPENISKRDPALIDIVNNKYWKYLDQIIEEAKKVSKLNITVDGDWRDGSFYLNN